MTREIQFRFKGATGPIVAVCLMWLLGCAANFVLLHANTWWFLSLDGFDRPTLEQVGGYFVARTATQLPALYVAGFVIALSGLKHPCRAAFLLTSGLHLLLLGVRALRWPWTQFEGLNQSIPILAETASLSVLAGAATAFTWFFTRRRMRPGEDSA